MLAAARFCLLLAIAFAAGSSAVFAQDIDDPQYNEDYERMQQIIKISNPEKRVEQLLVFYKLRPKLNSQIRDYADGYFIKDLRALLGQQKYAQVKKICQGALAIRPKFAEAWFSYGVALKNENNLEEAVMAFTKSYVIQSPIQKDAKAQLDLAYRAAHSQSLVGEDKLIKKVKEELK
jgi:tetratricopeptide (TPR) repeat protein